MVANQNTCWKGAVAGVRGQRCVPVQIKGKPVGNHGTTPGVTFVFEIMLDVLKQTKKKIALQPNKVTPPLPIDDQMLRHTMCTETKQQRFIVAN